MMAEDEEDEYQNEVLGEEAELLNSEREALCVILRRDHHYRSYDDTMVLRHSLNQSEFSITPLWEECSPRQLDLICSIAAFQSYESDKIVWKLGDHREHLFVVISGSCYAYLEYDVKTIDGPVLERREILVDSFATGHFFGEKASKAADLPSTPHDCSVKTKTACELLVLPRNLLVSILHSTASGTIKSGARGGASASSSASSSSSSSSSSPSSASLASLSMTVPQPLTIALRFPSSDTRYSDQRDSPRSQVCNP